MDSDEAQKGELFSNPLLAQLVVVKMEETMDKLRLLDYEKRFCGNLRIKPLPRYQQQNSIGSLRGGWSTRASPASPI